MRMSIEMDAEHVEGFTLLPIRSTEQAIDRRNRRRAFTAQGHLETHFPEGRCFARFHRRHLLRHGQEVVEADQISTRAFVVAALTLQIVEAIGLQRRRDDRQQGRLDTDLLHADVIGSKQRVIEPLAR